MLSLAEQIQLLYGFYLAFQHLFVVRDLVFVARECLVVEGSQLIYFLMNFL